MNINMEHKNIVATIYLKDGKAIKARDNYEDYPDVIELAKLYNDSGIDKIMIFDLSTTDEEHERNIQVILNINRNIEIKVCAGGNINRMEDIKKFIYAGCLQVIVNGSKPESMALAAEASKRFGKDRILVSVTNVDFIFKHQDEMADTFHEVLILNKAVIESHVPLDSITIMVQKEVADRMQVGPGTKDYGALSLAVQYYAKPQILLNVPASCFMPRPNVDSAVIQLTRYEKPPVEVADEHLMFRLIRASFNQRRKTMTNSVGNMHAIAFFFEQSR